MQTKFSPVRPRRDRPQHPAIGRSTAAASILWALLPGVAAAQSVWSEGEPLPVPTANNAVAALQVGGRPLVFSLLGIDSTRNHSGVHARTFRYDLEAKGWREIPGPPRARLAATAEAVEGRIYLFGGYTVAPDGSEKTLADVDIYDPVARRWSSGAPIPVPTDDAVSGVWRDSLIYLVSGWHDRGNISNVQIYDPAADSWQQATPIPGPPVFGHAGAIAGDAIVYIDGVRTAPESPRFRIAASSYVGRIDPTDPRRIEWDILPAHPGPPLYRAAAGALGERIVFAGGTNNPYNYDGIGYDGRPSDPRRDVFAFDVERQRWIPLAEKPLASMDHRGFAVAGRRLFLLGGMLAGQRVTDRVQVLELGTPE